MANLVHIKLKFKSGDLFVAVGRSSYKPHIIQYSIERLVCVRSTLQFTTIFKNNSMLGGMFCLLWWIYGLLSVCLCVYVYPYFRKIIVISGDVFARMVYKDSLKGWQDISVTFQPLYPREPHRGHMCRYSEAWFPVFFILLCLCCLINIQFQIGL